MALQNNKSKHFIAGFFSKTCSGTCTLISKKTVLF